MTKRISRNDWIFYGYASLAYSIVGILNSYAKYPDANFLVLLGNNFWHLVYVVALNISLFEFTFPFLFRKRGSFLINIGVSIPILFLYMIAYSFGLYQWRSLGIVFHIYTPLAPSMSVKKLLENEMAYSMGSLFLMAIARHTYHYVRLKQITQQLQIEKQQAELHYLKAQTNPHFLFNTLNNIYALTKDKSDLAPESVLRLSKILRFMLYETDHEFIALEQELKILTDYIELEKLRYDDTLTVNFKYMAENLKQAVPPLLLMLLVENAFKHGVSESRGRPFVDLQLILKNNQLEFTVRNSLDSFNDEMKDGIGLTNLRRQLELLYKDYRLSVRREQETFIAKLNINLLSHV